MGRVSKVEKLPKDVKDWLDKALVDENFSGYEELAETLRAHGYDISKSSVHRYGSNLERKLAAIRASTEAAKIITESAADDQNARSEAVIALVQTELFETIISLQEAAEENVTPADRIKLLSGVAKNISSLANASVTQKRHRMEFEEKVKRAAAVIDKIAADNGLSGNGRRLIKKELLGVIE